MATLLTGKWNSYRAKFPFLAGEGSKPDGTLGAQWKKLQRHDHNVRNHAYKFDTLWSQMKAAKDQGKFHTPLLTAGEALADEMKDYVALAKKCVATAKKLGKGQGDTIAKELRLLQKAQSYFEAQVSAKQIKTVLKKQTLEDKQRAWGLAQRAMAPLRDMEAIIGGLQKEPELVDYNKRLLPALRKFTERVQKAGAVEKYSQMKEFKDLVVVVRKGNGVIKPIKAETELARGTTHAASVVKVLSERLDKYANMVQRS